MEQGRSFLMRIIAWSSVGQWACLVSAMMAGCREKATHAPEPFAAEPAPITVAVAPPLNLSGSQDFDPLRLADLVASELTQLPGVRVVGPNRVLAALAGQGNKRILSPSHAVEICEVVETQAILVFAVNEYDPYPPIVVGLSAELYEAAGGPPGPGLDPGATRASQPLEMAAPRAQVQRVFDAAQDEVLAEVKDFARERSGEDTPYGWEKHLRTQTLFMRYCAHWTVRELMGQIRRPSPAKRVTRKDGTP